MRSWSRAGRHCASLLRHQRRSGIFASTGPWRTLVRCLTPGVIMKQYLAVFLGEPQAMNSFRNLPEAERKEREQRGMQAWMKWAQDNQGKIKQRARHSARPSRWTEAVLRRPVTTWAAGPSSKRHPTRTLQTFLQGTRIS